MRSLPLLFLLACPQPPDTDSDPESDTDTDADTDPEPSLEEFGGLALIRTYEAGELVQADLVGAFVNTEQGFLNVAQCLSGPLAPCVSELPPSPGESIPWLPADRFDPGPVIFRYVGLTVDFGPYQAFYEVNEQFSYYTADVTTRGPAEGPLDLALGVQWGDFRGDDVATAGAPLVLTAPAITDELRVFSDETSFELTWEPAESDSGELYLFLREPDPGIEGQIFRLEDDGSQALDFASLGLIGSRTLMFQLARWTRDTVDVNGNLLVVQTTAQSDWVVRYVDVQGRDPIQPVDDCELAFDGEKIDDGTYYGDLAGLGDDSQEAACLQSFDAANGRDGMIRVDVPPRHDLRVVYRQLAGDAAMYVYEGCTPVPPVCVLGEDRDPGQAAEILTTFNVSDTHPLEYLLVLDASDPNTGDLFFLDVERTPVPEPELVDTCVQALAADPLAPGRYYAGSAVGLANQIDPGFTGCTNTSMGGPEGLLPVLVPAGSTLEVTVVMDGGDPGIYLLPICNDTTTCLAGVDTPGSTEALVHTNTTGAEQQLYLVVDTKDTMGPYFLTVGVN